MGRFIGTIVYPTLMVNTKNRRFRCDPWIVAFIGCIMYLPFLIVFGTIKFAEKYNA